MVEVIEHVVTFGAQTVTLILASTFATPDGFHPMRKPSRCLDTTSTPTEMSGQGITTEMFEHGIDIYRDV